MEKSRLRFGVTCATNLYVTESPDDLLTTREVARRASVHTKTVADWAKNGKVPVIRLPGGDLRFRRSDVDDLLSPAVEKTA